MGIILSRVRKRKSPVETLEKLEHDIKEIEENRTYAQMRYRKITKLFLVYSLGLYILFGVFLYFHFTSTLKGKLLYLVPLALSPLLLYIVKRIIGWYYIRLINKNQKRLVEMKKEKKRILDEVMDKETYKVAKEILEKFSNEAVPKPSHNLQVVKRPEEGLRKRIAPVSSVPNATGPMIRSIGSSPVPRPISNSPVPARGFQGNPMLRFPAPILPLERSYMDKVVEYLIGDGPNNRYALICSRCSSHNGMALKEEFEYISFKCCYCYFFNPARKVRPEAPKLENLLRTIHESDSDSDSKTSGENSDQEPKALLDSTKELGDSLPELKENLTTSSNNEKVEKEEVEEKEVNQEPSEESNKPEEQESDSNCDKS